jgi:hypothetical protein
MPTRTCRGGCEAGTASSGRGPANSPDRSVQQRRGRDALSRSRSGQPGRRQARRDALLAGRGSPSCRALADESLPGGEPGCSLPFEVISGPGFIISLGAVVMGVLGLRRQSARSARTPAPPAGTAVARWGGRTWFGFMTRTAARLELSDWGIRVWPYSGWPVPAWEVRYYELRTVQPVTWLTARQGVLFRPDPSVATYRSRWSALLIVFWTWKKGGSSEILAQLEGRGVSVTREAGRIRLTGPWHEL